MRVPGTEARAKQAQALGTRPSPAANAQPPGAATRRIPALPAAEGGCSRYSRVAASSPRACFARASVPGAHAQGGRRRNAPPVLLAVQGEAQVGPRRAFLLRLAGKRQPADNGTEATLPCLST